MINGRYGRAYVNGLQLGEDSRFIKTVVTLKHWDAFVDRAQTTSPPPHATWTLTPNLPLPRNPCRFE